MRALLILTAIFIRLNYSMIAQTPVQQGFATLNWSDEFNSPNISTNNWLLVNNCDHVEANQLYKSSNIAVSNGALSITIKNEVTTFPSVDPSQVIYSSACGYYDNLIYYYSSGWLESQYLKSFDKGYIEARIKMPSTLKVFPGFWLWRDEDQNITNDAEIDIFEHVVEPTDLSSYSTNIHTNTSPLDNPTFGPEYENYVAISKPAFNFNEWHTYGLEKSDDRIIWYLDGEIVRVLYNHNITDSQRIIFNIKVDAEAAQLGATIFDNMYIDYVRVYDLNYPCANNGVICSSLFPSSSSFENLSFGNGSCVNIVQPNTMYRFNAENSITIPNNFECPLGAQIILLTGGCH
jgi:beta-glucanase (GH16 family)